MHDVLIIGGGVIGLSLAWDLAKHGQRVHVIDRGEPGKESSWAGAGILPPAVRAKAIHPLDQLRALTSELHPQWAQQLKELTGIDTGYRVCGGLYLARSAGEAASLAAWADSTAEEGVAVQRLTSDELFQLEPSLRGPSSPIRVAYRLPQEAQLRNPRHLQALLAACLQAGVKITSQLEAVEFAIVGSELSGVITPFDTLRAHRYCIASGAWTGQICQRLGIELGVFPMRGQMVLFNTDREGSTFPAPLLTHILNEGSRYLVPRDDGRILAGSTEEEVGFDKQTTAEGIEELVTFARNLVPGLKDAMIERTWAGLRPTSFDGLPYIGALPGLSNAVVATGHFRSGIYLSPATAVVTSQLLRDERAAIDLAPFRVIR